jgi:YidC/Oxa1 family membrane protein insertase
VALSPLGLVFVGLFALLAAAVWWTSRTTRRRQPPVPGVLGRLTRVLPYGTLLVAAYVPLAAVLYVVTTTIWTAAERATLWRTPITT